MLLVSPAEQSFECENVTNDDSRPPQDPSKDKSVGAASRVYFYVTLGIVHRREPRVRKPKILICPLQLASHERVRAPVQFTPLKSLKNWTYCRVRESTGSP